MYTMSGKKRPQFSLHHFNKQNLMQTQFRNMFGKNHPEDSFYQENKKIIPNTITPLRSDDVIVTSLETTLSRTASEKIFCLRKLKRINCRNFCQATSTK